MSEPLIDNRPPFVQAQRALLNGLLVAVPALLLLTAGFLAGLRYADRFVCAAGTPMRVPVAAATPSPAPATIAGIAPADAGTAPTPRDGTAGARRARWRLADPAGAPARRVRMQAMMDRHPHELPKLDDLASVDAWAADHPHLAEYFARSLNPLVWCVDGRDADAVGICRRDGYDGTWRFKAQTDGYTGFVITRNTD
jgi:hypothetical protein